MNFAQVHLLLNHFPILGTFFAFLLLGVGLLRKSEELKRVALWAFVLFALLALPVYFSGEPAEKVIEGLPGVTEQYIHAHEVMALFALTGIEVLGLLSLTGGLAFRRAKILPTGFVVVVFFLSLLVAGLMVQTGHLGGMIRHIETRNEFQPSSQEEEEKPAVPLDSSRARPDQD
jgi:uncharacterized membrane protein